MPWKLLWFTFWKHLAGQRFGVFLFLWFLLSCWRFGVFLLLWFLLSCWSSMAPQNNYVCSYFETTIRKNLLLHAAKYNTRVERQNYSLTNLEKDANFGVNFGRKRNSLWNNQQQQQNDKHSERQPNHQIEDQRITYSFIFKVQKYLSFMYIEQS